MQDYPTKIDGTSTEPAAEYNNLASELKTVVESMGLTLSAGSIIQLAQSISIYAVQGKYFTDSGAADAYVLTPSPVTREVPDQYYDGMEVYFLPDNINTGASTINVASLGVENILQADGISALTAGQLPANVFAKLIYDGTNFRLRTAQTTSLIAYRATPQLNIVSGGWTDVIIDTIIEENNLSLAVGTGIVTLTEGGLYSVIGSVQWEATSLIADKSYSSRILLTGSEKFQNKNQSSITGDPLSNPCPGLIRAVAGDTIKLQAGNDTGVNTVDINGGQGLTYLHIAKISN